jgi:hypothetical protein
MISLQVALEAMLASFHQLNALMKMTWTWPIVESVHFVGLTLLFGPIAAWDLRLVGVARGVPLSAFHRLVPYALLGFALNVTSGFLFLVGYPDQYVYNLAFQVKVVCILLAGLNAAGFYLFIFRRAATLAAGEPLPTAAQASGAISLLLWTTVILCGRMITFFRPSLCGMGEAAELLAQCIVR